MSQDIIKNSPLDTRDTFAALAFSMLFAQQMASEMAAESPLAFNGALPILAYQYADAMMEARNR